MPARSPAGCCRACDGPTWAGYGAGSDLRRVHESEAPFALEIHLSLRTLDTGGPRGRPGTRPSFSLASPGRDPAQRRARKRTPVRCSGGAAWHGHLNRPWASFGTTRSVIRWCVCGGAARTLDRLLHEGGEVAARPEARRRLRECEAPSIRTRTTTRCEAHPSDELVVPPGDQEGHLTRLLQREPFQMVTAIQQPGHCLWRVSKRGWGAAGP